MLFRSVRIRQTLAQRIMGVGDLSFDTGVPPMAGRSNAALPGFVGFVGALVGLFVGYLIRPSAPFVGQLDLGTVLSRGANLRGLDQALIPAAEASFNYAMIGAILGGLVGVLIGYISASEKVASSRIVMRSVEGPRLAADHIIELARAQKFRPDTGHAAPRVMP